VRSQAVLPASGLEQSGLEARTTLPRTPAVREDFHVPGWLPPWPLAGRGLPKREVDRLTPRPSVCLRPERRSRPASPPQGLP
jgi:hypothetical protein